MRYRIVNALFMLSIVLVPHARGQEIDDPAHRRGVTASTTAPAPKPADATDALKTFGNMGKQVRVLEGGNEAELYKHEGRGCLTHMWFGGDWHGYGRTRLRVYVDGEEKASIDMELMLGHGIGFEDDAAPWGVERIGKTGHPSGMYNTYRIPFGKGVRVTAQLPEDVKENPEFWWIIRGTENLPVEIAGVRLPDSARLRLYTRDNFRAKPLEEFDLCNVTRSGALYKVTIAARSENFLFLEACMRAYIDGAEKPLFLSSGLEDYFLGTYYFNRGKYYAPVAGLTHFGDKGSSSFSAHRFHEQDPVFFQKGLRLTCRCGEEVGGQVWNPKETTYTTYTWLYEW